MIPVIKAPRRARFAQRAAICNSFGRLLLSSIVKKEISIISFFRLTLVVDLLYSIAINFFAEIAWAFQASVSQEDFPCQSQNGSGPRSCCR
jgi:hypothetical protein